jgi:hypothetical protein
MYLSSWLTIETEPKYYLLMLEQDVIKYVILFEYMLTYMLTISKGTDQWEKKRYRMDTSKSTETKGESMLSRICCFLQWSLSLQNRDAE